MKSSPFLKTAALFLSLTFTVSISGCAMLKPGEYEKYGYKGTAEVKEGHRILPLDWLGNIFGVLEKLLLWNWKVERHWIREDAKQAIADYTRDNADVLGNVKVQLNRYAPQDDWSRLVHNHGVKWPYRLFLGTFTVLIVDTLLINRIFGGDYYNPYTHTVHLYSDLPSVALHELGHAKDFGERRYRGSYSLFRILPFVDLYQEYIASHKAFQYSRQRGDTKTEIEEYKVLYPAYGTYVGGYLGFGFIIPVIVGHIWGRSEARGVQAIADAKAKINPSTAPSPSPSLSASASPSPTT